jgi:ureidoglycolate lyase
VVRDEVEGVDAMSAAPPARLRVEPLSAEAFAPFGTVLAAEPGPGAKRVNEGRGRRADLDDLAHDPTAGRPRLALYAIAASAYPVAVALLERHRLSAQLFLPLGAGPFLVVVAPASPGGAPDLASLRAFEAHGRQGVVYAPGVWHMPLVALAGEGRFLMAMWESGDARDCEEWHLAPPWDVSPDPWRP